MCGNCAAVVEKVAQFDHDFSLCQSCLRGALQLCFPPDGPVRIATARPLVPVESADDSPQAAERCCREWLALNGVEPPAFRFLSGASDKHGCYTRRSRTVTVYVDTCRQSGLLKSRPGFWEDVTVTGVCAHEVGHHVAVTRQLSGPYYDPYMQESPVGVNARLDRHEDLADALMLFIRNPTLLRDMCPRRHAFLSERFKVTETRAWREILDAESIGLVEERLKPCAC
jgi:hypothetical protein